MLVALTAALLLALPAAQDPPAPTEASQASPEAAAYLEAMGTRVETAGQALEAGLAEIAPRAAEIRADPSLSDSEKTTRYLNLAASRQVEIDDLSEAVEAMVLYQLAAQGTPEAEAAVAAQAVRTQVSTAILAAIADGDLDTDD